MINYPYPFMQARWCRTEGDSPDYFLGLVRNYAIELKGAQ